MAQKRPPPQRPTSTPAEIDADADTLETLATDPRLVPGIYNYCDRWCERCSSTGRCLSFQMDTATRARRPAEPPGERAASFWDDLARSYALAQRLIEREAARLGIDLNAPGALLEAEREERRRRRVAIQEGSALHQATASYGRFARQLLDRLRPQLAATAAELQEQIRLGAGQPADVAADIGDALEVVQWYLFFIDTKLRRAVASRVDRARDGDDGLPSDADGSAKIALVAIDRSIGAWARLRGHFTAEADSILDLLVHLERLRRAVERDFPAARAFQRPGLD
jgi:hypothetical protein